MAEAEVRENPWTILSPTESGEASVAGIRSPLESEVTEEIAELAANLDEDLRSQVEEANRKLEMYAEELRQLAERERLKAFQLEQMNQQLRAYARDLKASVERERQRAKDLEAAYLETVTRLTTASAFKDRETGSHINRLSHYCRILALEVGCSEEEADLLYVAAPMHDLGKIGIPDRVLLKEGPLDAEEWAIMKQHPMIGANLLEGSRSVLLETARQVALAHHERWDGTGYPIGLKGEEIPLPARILAVADTYDALRSIRPYKNGFSHEHTCKTILEGDSRTRPEHFDPAVLEAFQRVKDKFAEIFDSIQGDDEDSELM